MIGIFDSGVGGLTVLKQIRACAPDADIVYFGDTRNAPYGNRSKEEVGALTILGIQKLIDAGATEIVSACNSVSVSIVDPVLESLQIASTSIIEMVGPTVTDFKKRNRDEKILLLATQVTIDSGIYQKSFTDIEKEIDTLVLPELAGAIEAGKSRDEIRKIITESFQDIAIDTYETIILGCTHYPLVIDIFREVVGDTIELYDPAIAVAHKVCKSFGCVGSGKTKFIFSEDGAVNKYWKLKTSRQGE